MKINVILLIIACIFNISIQSMEEPQTPEQEFSFILSDNSEMGLKKSHISQFDYLKRAFENGMKETHNGKIQLTDLEPADVRIFINLLQEYSKLPEKSKDESLLKKIVAIPNYHEHLMGFIHKADEWRILPLHKALLRAIVYLLKNADCNATEAIEHSKGNTKKALEQTIEIVREKKHEKKPREIIQHAGYPFEIPELKQQIIADIMPKVFGKSAFEIQTIPAISCRNLNSMSYDAEANKVILCSNDQIVSHDAITGKADPSINNQSLIKTTCFDLKNKRIITAGYHGLVKVWNINGAKIKDFQHSTHRCVSALAIKNDGLAAGGHDKLVHLWDNKTTQKKSSLPTLPGFPNAIVFENNGLYVAHELGLHFWDSNSGILKNFITQKTPTISTPFKCLEQHPNEHFLIVSGGKQIFVLDKRNKEVVGTFNGHTGNVYSLIVSPESQCLISGGYDKKVHIWDLQTHQTLQTIEKQHHETLAFDHQNLRLFTNGLNGAINVSKLPNDPKKLLELYADQLEMKKNN